MNKTLKFLLTTFVALILIFNNLFSFIALNNGNLSDRVQAANLKVNIPLSFTPSHTIIHPNKPILYLTHKASKKLYSINYETGEIKSIQFDLPTERIAFANGEIYVTLLKHEHDYYGDAAGDGAGAIAIIDPNDFTLKDRFDVAVDPFDIAVDAQGFIYVFGGSDQTTFAKSYSRETKKEVASIDFVDTQSYIQFNSKNSKLYTIPSKTSPKDITVYETNNGNYIGTDYNSPYHGDYEMTANFKLSPDGKYIFNTAGTIFNSSDSKYDDMTYVTSLNTDFSDVAFNIDQNKFYVGIKDNKIAEYDYTNFNILKYHYTLGTVNSLFFRDNNLIALSKDSKNRCFIESIPLNSPAPISESDKVFNEEKYAITNAVYDSSRNKVYALNKTLNNLFVMDAETNKLEKTIKLPYKLSNLAVSEDFSKLYIVNEDENYLVSEYDLDSFANTRNLSYKIERNSKLENGHRHIYEKNNRLYVVGGEIAPKLYIFDTDNFNEIKYSSKIEEAGDITFSSDGKYFYKWSQYGWSAGSTYSYVIKYLVDGDKISEVKKIQDSYMSRDPLDTPIMILDKKGLLICKDKVFDLNDSYKLIRTFSEPIYAVDEDRNLAVGKTKIFNLDTGKAARYMPNHTNNNVFFDKNGKLHFFIRNNMYSMDPSAPIGKLEPLRSMPADKETDNPIDFPIVIQYPDKIELINEKNILLSDDKKYYAIKATISGNMLVIAHEDLPYNSKITLIVGDNTVSSSDGSKYNSKLTINFYTGKEYNRISGLNRYETSVKVSGQWPNSKYAVLASGQDFADALSAAPLATKYNAPILLTTPKELDTKTESEIKRLGVSEIFIIGGYASVSKEIEDKLTSKGIKITRLHGKDRYQTAMAVANFIGTNGEIFIAAGSNFPDALSIASYAAAQGIPIILTKKDTLPEGLEKYISDYHINKTYVIGGPGVISNDLLNSLPGNQRIYGKNRYQTNARVLSTFDFYFGTAFIASGQGFADALSASALAGLSQSPIVLADKNLLYNNEAIVELSFLTYMMKMKYIVGGEGSVPSSVIDKIFK